MVIHQLAANDDEDDQLKAEQVNIVDPPQDQLREPALDVLAPLITEDYRPAPPPPQDNAPKVTHTVIDVVKE